MMLLSKETFARLSADLRRQLLTDPYVPPSSEVVRRLNAELDALYPATVDDPYVQEADANPERADNGCMIYKGAA